MKTLIAALTLGTLVTAPAFAQSHDHDLGTGNVAASSDASGYTWSVGHSAFARVAPRKGRSRSAHRAYNAVMHGGADGGGFGSGDHMGGGHRRDVRCEDLVGGTFASGYCDHCTRHPGDRNC